MIAAGISYRRLAFPALAFGLMLSVGAFWFNESVVPGAYSRARYLEKVRIDGRSESVLTQRRNVFVKGVGDRFYFMQEYLPDRQEMIYPTILEIDESGTGVRERIDADSARLVADASGSHHWEFVGAQRWVFEDGVVADYQQFSELQLPMEDDLDRFLSRSRRPEEMNIRELNEYIAMVSRRGGERVERFATMMHQKIAFPAVCLMMTLLGFVASVDLHARRFARSALSGLVVAIVYYLTDATLVSLGGDGFLPPFIAAWASVIGLLGVVLWMLRRLDNTGF